MDQRWFSCGAGRFASRPQGDQADRADAVSHGYFGDRSLLQCRWNICRFLSRQTVELLKVVDY
jgi:hypothetical protein